MNLLKLLFVLVATMIGGNKMATGQTPTTPPASSSDPTTAPVRSEADRAFAPLHRELYNLAQSIINTRSLTDEHRPLLEDYLERLSAFSDEWPDYPRAIQWQLQVLDWLNNNEEAAQFTELLKRLVNVQPDRAEFRLLLATRLRKANQYDEAIDTLKAFEFDLTKNPEAASMLAENLRDQNRFEEALEVIDTLPDSVDNTNSTIVRMRTTLRPTLERYVADWKIEQELRLAEAEADDLPRVELMTDAGRIEIELFENDVPNTVANFLTLVEDGFYDGLTFHELIAGLKAETGCPNTRAEATGSKGFGDPGYFIADENRGNDARRHFAGSVSMDNNGNNKPNSAGSRFFFSYVPANHLNSRYTVFGRVVGQLDVLHQLKKDDPLLYARVIRKREHEYVVEKIDKDQPTTLPATPITPTTQPNILIPDLGITPTDDGS